MTLELRAVEAYSADNGLQPDYNSRRLLAE